MHDILTKEGKINQNKIISFLILVNQIKVATKGYWMATCSSAEYQWQLDDEENTELWLDENDRRIPDKNNVC